MDARRSKVDRKADGGELDNNAKYAVQSFPFGGKIKKEDYVPNCAHTFLHRPRIHPWKSC